MSARPILAAFMILLMAMPALTFESGGSSAPEFKSVVSVTTFEGNQTERTVSLKPGVEDVSTTVTLPAKAKVVSATLEVTSGPATPGGKDYPVSPELDIGADGYAEWAFDGRGYGAMGYQDTFLNDSGVAAGYNMTFEKGERKTLRTRLPAGAAVERAALGLSGWPAPFWQDPIRISPGTDSPGEATPVIYTGPDRLWAAWATKSPGIHDGTDWDIVVSWSFNGVDWASPVELTPPGDNYVDDCPYLAYFDGRIYVAWSSAETESFYSPARIYLRSWDGSAWSPMLELTPPGLNFINDQPYLTVYNNNTLLVFWRTNDPSIANSVNEGDLDIVYRAYDKLTWSPTGEFTPDWCDDFDWSLTCVDFRGKLYAFWDPDVDMSPTSLEPDVYYRVFNGSAWSQETCISPGPSSTLDECPEEGVYHNPATGQDELWCFWIRSGLDAYEFDIMAKKFDGTSWGSMVQLTTPDDSQSNECQKVVEHDGRLYVVYVEEVFRTMETKYNVTVFVSYGDILIRSFDGARWSAPIELTPEGAVDNATSPSIAIYNGKLYVAWAFPYGEYENGWDSWDVIARTYDFRPVELVIDLGNDDAVDWGPSDPGPGGETIVFTDDAVRRSIDKEAKVQDGWGNVYADVQLGLGSANPSVVVVENLAVTYSYTFRLDNFSACLNDLLRANAPPGGEGDVTLPIGLRSLSTGKLVLKSLNITYTLNFPPVLLDPIPDRSLPEDTDALRVMDLEQYFWDDWDDGKLRFEIAPGENPSLIDAKLDGSWLSFFTPTENWFGTLRFRVRAYDSEGLWAESNLFNITVTPVNDPPVQTRDIAAKSFPEDTDAFRLLDLKDYFWDVEDGKDLGFAVTFEENASLLHAVLDGSWLSFFTPVENWHGTMRFRVRASDSGGLLVDGREFKVTVDPVNDAPVPARDIPNQSLQEDTDALRLVSVEGCFRDVDGDALSYEVVYEENARLLHAELNGSWLSFFTPTENWHGMLRFRVRARDPGGLMAESNTFNVTVTPVNDAPVLARIPDQSVSVGSVVKLVVLATDVENDTLTFSTNSARYRVQPTAGKYGTGTVRFIAEGAGTLFLNISVSDGNGGVAYQRVRITVSERLDRSELCWSLGMAALLIALAMTAARHYVGKRKRRGIE